MAHSVISSAEEMSNEQIKDQEHADLFFCQEGYRAQRICSTRTNCQPSVYKSVLENLRKRVIRVRPEIADKWMLHHDNARVTRPFPSVNF